MSFHSNILTFPARPAANPTDSHKHAVIRRPAVLVRAARVGLEQWNRSRDLRRLLGGTELPAPGHALARLIAEEAALDESRRAGGADYDPRRHVLLAVAILAERRAATLAELLPPRRAR